MREIAGDRERRRGKNPAGTRGFAQFTQWRREIERRRVKREALRRQLIPLHRFMRGAVEHRMQALTQRFRALVRAAESARAFGLRR